MTLWAEEIKQSRSNVVTGESTNNCPGGGDGVIVGADAAFTAGMATSPTFRCSFIFCISQANINRRRYLKAHTACFLCDLALS